MNWIQKVFGHFLRINDYKFMDEKKRMIDNMIPIKHVHIFVNLNGVVDENALESAFNTY